MSHGFDINFDVLSDEDIEDRTLTLDIVITPIDAFDRRIVRGIGARIENLGKRAGVSLSGHLVFERLPRDMNQHQVAFDMAGTGYFDEPPRQVPMPQVRVAPAQVFPEPAMGNPDPLDAALAGDTRLLRLIRRPEAVIDGEAMIVRGGVIRDGSAAGGVEVTGSIIGEPGLFASRTNEKGNFAIRLRLPPPPLDAGPVAVPRRAHVRLLFDGGNEWRSDQDNHLPGPDRRLFDMATHVIPAPIDIT